MPDVDRRRFLTGLGAAGALGAGIVVRAVPARAQASPAPFGWGVASFDPTPTSVLLWTRVAASDGTGVGVTWAVFEDAACTRERATGTVRALADDDHTVRVEVDGLEPGRAWWYRFSLADGTTSPIGRTRTTGGAERLRLGVVSCARFATAGFAVYRALAERDVDVVVHVGDYVYEDGQADERAHEPAHRCTTLADYRARYAQHRADPDLQALHAAHPMVAVWDDHEVAGNTWRNGAAQHDQASDGSFQERVVAAGRAHDEWVPGRTGTGDDGRLRAWRSLDLGPLAELVVLDTRTWGRDRQPASAAELDPSVERSMLGADQLAFVRDRLEADGRRPWTFLANQVMLHPLRIPVPAQALVDAARRGGFVVDGAYAVNPDQWDGYPAARTELLDVVGDRGGVVALTGDVHSSWAWDGPAEAGGQPAMVELVTPSVTSQPFAERLSIPASLLEVGLRVVSPDLRHVELVSHGYVLVDCTADQVQAEWWYVDPDDPTTERFGAAVTTPREVPMGLVASTEPTEDRPLPTGPPDGHSGSASGDDASDSGGPPIAVTAGAAAGIALVAAGLAVRRRR